VVSRDKFILGEIKNKLYVQFNMNNNSVLKLHNIDRIFDTLQADKLFLEKLDLEVNEEIFASNFNENKIRTL